MDYHSQQNSGCRMLEYRHLNSTFLRLENDVLALTVWLDKGADITELRYKPADLDFMWQAPVGLRDITRSIPTTPAALGNNLDYYEGGWHECLPGGGPYSEGGNQQGLHGEAALLPWSWRLLQDDPGRLEVELCCRLLRTPLLVTKRICLERGSATVFFEETVQNTGGQALQFLWGHHPTFGRPFLAPFFSEPATTESTLVSPTFETTTGLFEKGSRLPWPLAPKEGAEIDLSRIPDEGTATADLFIFDELRDGWYALVNEEQGLGFGMAWDKEVFPCVWYWKVLNGLYGYPWYGATYNIGLEFWSGWPDYAGAKATGRLTKLAAGSEINTRYTAVVFPYSGGNIAAISQQGEVKEEAE